jgi:hypothetical protein
MTDEEIRDLAQHRYSVEAVAKFNRGIAEHNPNGDKGLYRMSMSPLQILNAIDEELIDAWHYSVALRMKITTLLLDGDDYRKQIAKLEKEISDLKKVNKPKKNDNNGKKKD